MKHPSLNKKCLRFSKSPGLSPAAMARRAVLKRIQRQELRKLQALLPQFSGRSSTRQPDPCSVVLQAVQYIDNLHATILSRVRSGSLSPEVLRGLNLPQIQQVEEARRRYDSVQRRPMAPRQSSLLLSDSDYKFSDFSA